MNSNENKDDSRLLILPQSDLKRSTRPDLVLMALPNENVQQALVRGECKLLTNSKSSSLVLPTTSYLLTTVGTSNTLVVYPETKKKETEENNPNKRIKLDMNIQSCRLIHPGGSGASFLSLEQKNLSSNDIRSFLEQQQQEEESSSSKKYLVRDLALEFQCSIKEIQQVLETLPCVLLESTQTKQQDQGGYAVTLLTEEQVLQAQRALLQALCEEQEGEADEALLETLVPLVAKRITHYQEETDHHSISQETWSQTVAKQILKLSCKGSDSTTVAGLDKEKIGLWALQDLVMNKSTWELEDLLSTWQLRLPNKWCGQEDEGGESGESLVSRRFLEKLPGVEITKEGDKNNITEKVTIKL